MGGVRPAFADVEPRRGQSGQLCVLAPLRPRAKFGASESSSGQRVQRASCRSDPGLTDEIVGGAARERRLATETLGFQAET
eukprot:14621940-Alexandrium_andersonii.AAC.1